MRQSTRTWVAAAAAVLGLTTVPAAIVTQPSDASVLGTVPATLVVRAAGTEPLSYQWRRNGVALAGGTGAAFVTSEAGVYEVSVENEAGRDTSRLVTVSVPKPVVIVQQPVSQTVAAGRRVAFKVVASGTPGAGQGALVYQWRKDGVVLEEKAGSVEGVQTDTLVLPSVDPGSATAAGAALPADAAEALELALQQEREMEKLSRQVVVLVRQRQGEVGSGGGSAPPGHREAREGDLAAAARH
jgi:hypothetical protein